MKSGIRGKGITNWTRRVRDWEQIYNTKRIPDTILTRSIFCRKCNSTNHIQKHHKGHEALFAGIVPDYYAKRYVEFHPEDTVALCHECHQVIHLLYTDILLNKYSDINSASTIKELEKVRRHLIRECHKWLKRKTK